MKYMLLFFLFLCGFMVCAETAETSDRATVLNCETMEIICKININQASLDQLCSLHGIGKKTAAKIIEYREKKKFDSVQELEKVSGISEKLVKKIQHFVSVSDSDREIRIRLQDLEYHDLVQLGVPAAEARKAGELLKKNKSPLMEEICTQYPKVYCRIRNYIEP